MIFSYNKLYEPFAGEKHSLEATIEWLKKTTGVDEKLVNLVVAETMQKVSQGEKFGLPCPCGCEIDLPNATIDHFMLARTFMKMKEIQASKIKVLEEMEKTLVEARMKQLVNSGKQMYEAIHGNWWQRNMPTFRKWLRFKD